ncbi:Holliday junction resolvase [Litchfieldella anticariensis FP35 = DSM 16096]|uniref:Putative pre-16S rRNA nuclease n=1 Tax=Litchfieldella anticariensis (strain DSM 16096 / CECT 5854 / CIP 108499 / LMG 22089 / FP35) TaxID=1121939 RepID=S2KFG5_LITA3|nr:Holliday junction resolvase RuvX [Halomonas anticariensis]EPC00665.1 Holliday junction resolvase [Halomonas anticariensis FP35 = DSM 16096]
MATAGQRLILAFDFGVRRIGVAVGNEILGQATVLEPLPARDGIPDWNEMTRLVDEWHPDLFVVGLPLNMDGSESEMSTRARKFGKRLYGRYGKPCEMVDERGSTREAKAIAREQGHRGNYREEGVDGIAAQLILESFFALREGLPPRA